MMSLQNPCSTPTQARLALQTNTRRFILAALFLIFSTACASPLYIAARSPDTNPVDLLNIKHNELQAMIIKGHGIVYGSLGELRTLPAESQAIKYQLLILRPYPGRNIATDVDRYKKSLPKGSVICGGEGQICARKVGQHDYIFFKDGTFGDSPPAGMTKKQMHELRQNAGEAYPD
ncbi:hypothetical protein AX14_013012 [Amanita brunnescens Koide BX004]|nr:hypothetical protein AX14_013012 [Amanita brunnescens Koide BX004]